MFENFKFEISGFPRAVPPLATGAFSWGCGIERRYDRIPESFDERRGLNGSMILQKILHLP